MKPAEGVTSKRARAHCCLQTEGFIGKEEPGEGLGEFFIVTCPLSVARGSQGTGPCVLVRVLGNRTFQSWTNVKNRMLLGAVKELGLVFWHRYWETKCFPLERLSLWEPNNSRVKQSLRWYKRGQVET
jgi:hypothetical protein